jgi:hypothetical protein
MIKGIHASLYVPENYFDGIGQIRDQLGVAILREYKAGASGRNEKGSPSWAEFPGIDAKTVLVVAARGVFGDDIPTGPAFILESTDPEADATVLSAQDFRIVVPATFDRWWHTFAVVENQAGLRYVLVQNTGDFSDSEQQEADALNAR